MPFTSDPVIFSPASNTYAFSLKKGVKVYGGYYNVANTDDPPRDFSKTVLGYASTGGIIIYVSGTSSSSRRDITGALYDGFTISKSTVSTDAAISITHTIVTDADAPVLRNIIITQCVGGGGGITVKTTGTLTGTQNGSDYVETDNKPILFENMTITQNSSIVYGTAYFFYSNVRFIKLNSYRK